MTDPKALQIAKAISTRLAQITQANGYHTNIGTHVFRGKLALSEDDVPGVTVMEDDDLVLEQSDTHDAMVSRYLNLSAEGIVACDPANPNDAAHLVLADIKRALWDGDLSFGGLVAKLAYKGQSIGARPDGLALVNARVEFMVLVAHETLNNP